MLLPNSSLSEPNLTNTPATVLQPSTRFLTHDALKPLNLQKASTQHLTLACTLNSLASDLLAPQTQGRHPQKFPVPGFSSQRPLLAGDGSKPCTMGPCWLANQASTLQPLRSRIRKMERSVDAPVSGRDPFLVLNSTNRLEGFLWSSTEALSLLACLHESGPIW